MKNVYKRANKKATHKTTVIQCSRCSGINAKEIFEHGCASSRSAACSQLCLGFPFCKISPLIPWLQDESYWSRANHFKLPEPRNKFLLGDGLKKILAWCCSCSCWKSCLKTACSRNNHPSFGSYCLSAPMDQGRVTGDLPGRLTRQTPQSSRAYLTFTFSIVKSCGSP